MYVFCFDVIVFNIIENYCFLVKIIVNSIFYFKLMVELVEIM